jgi:hypothetical protein
VNLIPDWTRSFVTATTETEQGETITRYTGWRLVIDLSCIQRYPSWGEVDVTVVADDQGHNCDCLGCASVYGSPCATSATNLLCASTPSADEADMVNEAARIAAEQGFRISGPWISGSDGTLTACLAILDLVGAAR